MPWLADLALRLHDIAEVLRTLESSLLQIALFIIFATGLWNFVKRL
jgi:hypothetical protein